MEPGCWRGQLVVEDIEAAWAELSGRGVEVSEIQDFPGGRFVFFSDPDGNDWAVQQIPDYGEGDRARGQLARASRRTALATLAADA